jgi:hypothetical protein
MIWYLNLKKDEKESLASWFKKIVLKSESVPSQISTNTVQIKSDDHVNDAMPPKSKPWEQLVHPKRRNNKKEASVSVIEVDSTNPPRGG